MRPPSAVFTVGGFRSVGRCALRSRHLQGSLNFISVTAYLDFIDIYLILSAVGRTDCGRLLATHALATGICGAHGTSLGLILSRLKLSARMLAQPSHPRRTAEELSGNWRITLCSARRCRYRLRGLILRHSQMHNSARREHSANSGYRRSYAAGRRQHDPEIWSGYRVWGLFHIDALLHCQRTPSSLSSDRCHCPKTLRLREATIAFLKFPGRVTVYFARLTVWQISHDYAVSRDVDLPLLDLQTMTQGMSFHGNDILDASYTSSAIHRSDGCNDVPSPPEGPGLGVVNYR